MTSGVTLCEILCDSCAQDIERRIGTRIVVSHDLTPAQAADVARAAGWTVRTGGHRAYHFCPKHLGLNTQPGGPL